MSDYVLLNKVSTNVLCLMLLTTFLLTPFAFLISLPSAAIKEYIFYFNPTNALIIFYWQNQKTLNLVNNH